MPFYEYRCRECGEKFDVFVRSISGSYEVECPKCHSDKCAKSISLFGTASNGASVSASAANCAPSG
jgi:putative FmdB family regulatory protein